MVTFAGFVVVVGLVVGLRVPFCLWMAVRLHDRRGSGGPWDGLPLDRRRSEDDRRVYLWCRRAMFWGLGSVALCALGRLAAG
jgi:hypothetical protein